MKRSLALLSGSLATLALPALAATPRLDDYARGITIEAEQQRPLVQLDVPDTVYRTVVTNDLSDVRVFNADGVPVPHALCAAPVTEPPTISQESLPAYRLQDLPAAASDGTRVEVQTPSGAQISVQGAPNAATADRQTSAYVIDARDVPDELRAVQFDWSSPDGASEVRVSIQASDDLDRWRTLVAATTLVQLQSDGRQLRRHRVAIPQGNYDFLRVERVDRGPPLRIDGVIAERVTPAPVIEPVWFTANAVSASEPNTFQFETGRRAPITYARLTPTQENSSLHIAIESRAEPKSSWTTEWTGEVYSIQSDTERRISPPAELAPRTHAEWRVRLAKEGDVFYQTPVLELGYRPARLRFVAQGAGPYTLAFGSRRAESGSARACDGLLANLPPAELQQNIEQGYAGAERTLGGEDAFRPLPKKTPLRQIVLWGVLVLGVGALVAMALSLLRRLKPDGAA
jgi:hypothetical protein